MRMIHGVLFTAGLLGGAMAIQAQEGRLPFRDCLFEEFGKGETAADQLAQIYSSLPTLRK